METKEVWLVTGTTGFLAPRIVRELAKNPDREVIALPRKLLDFTEEEQVLRVFETYHPDILVHAGAVSDTGVCERDPENTRKVNVDGPRYLAKACGLWGTKMIYLSSDQVYKGATGVGAHREEEELSPSNVYGRQKLESEELVDQYCKDGVSLRLTWMYDLPGELSIKPNFVTRILDGIKGETEMEFSANAFRGITDGRTVAANLAACRDLPKGSYNFGSPNTLNDYETALMTAEMITEDPHKYIHMASNGFHQNLSIDTGKIEQHGICFPNTLEGICRSLSDYGYKKEP